MSTHPKRSQNILKIVSCMENFNKDLLKMPCYLMVNLKNVNIICLSTPFLAVPLFRFSKIVFLRQ